MTTSTLLRSKNPLAHFPEFVAAKDDIAALRRRTARCDACDRRVDALERQRARDAETTEEKMTALSNAFRVLSDVVVSELESLRGDVRAQKNEIQILREQVRWMHGAEVEVTELRDFVQRSVVEDGASREKRNDVLLARVAKLENRIDTCERVVEENVAETEKKVETEFASAVSEAAYRKSCETRLDFLENRARIAEEGLTRAFRAVARNEESSRPREPVSVDRDAERSAAESSDDFSLRGAAAWRAPDGGGLVPNRNAETPHEVNVESAFERLGVASVTAEARISSATRR